MPELVITGAITESVSDACNPEGKRCAACQAGNFLTEPDFLVIP